MSEEGDQIVRIIGYVSITIASMLNYTSDNFDVLNEKTFSYHLTLLGMTIFTGASIADSLQAPNIIDKPMSLSSIIYYIIMGLLYIKSYKSDAHLFSMASLKKSSQYLKAKIFSSKN